MTINAGKNQHPSNFKVSLISIASFATITCLFIAYNTVNGLLDKPYSFTIESCANRFDPVNRPIPRYNIVFFQMPALFNVCSLLLDVVLIKFLRRTIRPQFVNPQAVELLNTISGRLDQGIN